MPDLDDWPQRTARVTLPCPHCKKDVDFKLGKRTNDAGAVIHMQQPQGPCPHCGKELPQLPESAYDPLDEP